MSLTLRATTFTIALLVSLAATLTLTVAGAVPAQEQSGGEEPAMVRMAHLSPDTPKGDIYIDGEPVEPLQGVPFGVVSPYLPLPEGESKVEIYAAGETPQTSEPALEVRVRLEGGSWYTLAAVGLLEDETLAAKLYEDQNSPPPEGEAKLRVVHAVPDVGPATVSAKGAEDVDDPLFILPDFSNASYYADVPAGTYTLDLKPAGADEAAMSIPDVTLSPGAEPSAPSSSSDRPRITPSAPSSSRTARRAAPPSRKYLRRPTRLQP